MSRVAQQRNTARTVGVRGESAADVYRRLVDPTATDAQFLASLQGAGAAAGDLSNVSNVNFQAKGTAAGLALASDVAANTSALAGKAAKDLSNVTNADLLTKALAAGAARWELAVALSDETTAITSGAAKVTVHALADVRVTGAFIGLSGASSSGVVTVDVNKAGTSIFTTNPTIGASQKKSLSGTGSVAAVLNGTVTFAQGDEITFDIDAAGTGAKGLKVYLIGYRTS